MTMHKKNEFLTTSYDEFLKSDPLLTDSMIVSNPYEVLEETEKYNFEDFESMIEMDARHKRELERRHYIYFNDNAAVSAHATSVYKHPRDKAYQQWSASELYRIPKDDFQENVIQKSKSFLGELHKPYDIKDQRVKDICEKLVSIDEDIALDALESLKEYIPKVDHNQLPEILLFLAFEAKCKDYMLWKVIEETLNDDFRMYNFIQLNKIIYAYTHCRPKDSTAHFNRKDGKI